MKTGLLLNADAIAGPALASCAARAESIGLDALWVPEIFGREPFVTAGALMGATSSIEVGTAIANVYVRDPMATKAAAQTLRDIHGDRFNLGLGVSNVVGNSMRGHEWLAPVDKLEAFFDAMEDWRLSFKVEGTPPVYLAAHGPKLLEFARRRADGAFMYLTSGHYLSEARVALGDKQLLMMQPCVVSDNLDDARRMARRVVGVYTDLPNYQRAWKAQGFSEADYVDGPSDGLLDELIALGTLDQVQAKLEQRRLAGVDRMIIIPLNLGPQREPDWEIVSRLIGEQS